jgi:hypothetical protein
VIPREKALEIYNKPILPDLELVEYVKKRLSFSDEEYTSILNGPKRSYKDFKTYKKRFEKLRPLFYLLSQAELVPRSFYIKYCFPLPNE